MSSKKSNLKTNFMTNIKDLKTIIAEEIDNNLDPEKKEKRIDNNVLNDRDVLILCACFNLSAQLLKLIEKGDFNHKLLNSATASDDLSHEHLSSAAARKNGDVTLQTFLKDLSYGKVLLYNYSF